jgi:hypothetical protein
VRRIGSSSQSWRYLRRHGATAYQGHGAMFDGKRVSTLPQPKMQATPSIFLSLKSSKLMMG